MSKPVDQDNPTGMGETVPQVIKYYDPWTGRRSFHSLGLGEKIAHFCPECGDWWGCQADPCDNPAISTCGACIQVFGEVKE